MNSAIGTHFDREFVQAGLEVFERAVAAVVVATLAHNELVHRVKVIHTNLAVGCIGAWATFNQMILASSTTGGCLSEVRTFFELLLLGLELLCNSCRGFFIFELPTFLFFKLLP